MSYTRCIRSRMAEISDKQLSFLFRLLSTEMKRRGIDSHGN